MGSFQIFQYIFDQLETPFLDSVGSLIQAFENYAAIPVQTALVLYVVLSGVLLLRGQASEPVGGLVGRAIKLALVAWFATNGSVYTTWVQNFFLNSAAERRHSCNHGCRRKRATRRSSANSLRFHLEASPYEAGLRVWRLLDYWDVRRGRSSSSSSGRRLSGRLHRRLSRSGFLSHVILGPVHHHRPACARPSSIPGYKARSSSGGSEQ